MHIHTYACVYVYAYIYRIYTFEVLRRQSLSLSPSFTTVQTTDTLTNTPSNFSKLPDWEMQQSRTHESSKTLKIKIVYNSYTARRVSHHQPLLCKHIKLFWCYTLLESCFKYFMNVCTNSCLFFYTGTLAFFSVIQTHTFFCRNTCFLSVR